VYFLLEYKKGKKRIFNGGQKAGCGPCRNKKDGRGTTSEDRFQTDRMPNSSAPNCEAGFPVRPNISGQIFIIFVSIYLGFFIISNYLILLSLLKIKFGFLNAAVFGLAFFAAFIFIQIFRVKRAKYPKAKLQYCNTKDNSANKGNKYQSGSGANKDFEYAGSPAGLKSLVFQAIFAFLIFINSCVVTFFTFLFPIRFWDAISCWSLKGRAFFLDGSVTAFYTQHHYTFTHLTYPLYISLSQTWIYIWLGEINETLVKAIFPLFYLSLVFIVYYLLRNEVKRLYAIISAFILSTLPVIMDHGYLEYTNLIFSVILLLGVYYFYIYILRSSESQKRITSKMKIPATNLLSTSMFKTGKHIGNQLLSKPFEASLPKASLPKNTASTFIVGMRIFRQNSTRWLKPTWAGGGS
jgi:hypothetical protein